MRQYLVTLLLPAGLAHHPLAQGSWGVSYKKLILFSTELCALLLNITLPGDLCGSSTVIVILVIEFRVLLPPVVFLGFDFILFFFYFSPLAQDLFAVLFWEKQALLV